jgi:hypothetical protein
MSVSLDLIPAEILCRKGRLVYFCVGSRVIKDELKTCTPQFFVKLVMYQVDTLNLNGNCQNLVRHIVRHKYPPLHFHSFWNHCLIVTNN